MSENYDLLQTIASEDVLVLQKKGETYGSSWKQRGGQGAFMMLARKWDRIENQCKKCGYDIFTAILNDPATADGVMDDIADLRRYLLLVEGEIRARGHSLQGGNYAHKEVSISIPKEDVPDKVCANCGKPLSYHTCGWCPGRDTKWVPAK